MALGEHLRADQDVERRPRATRSRTPAKAPLRRVLSRSTRAMRASGKRAAERALEPLRAVAERHEVDVAARRDTPAAGARHGRNDGSAASAARDATMSRALQRGQPASQPHDEQMSDGANPRRLTKTSDCSPRASRAASAVTQRRADAVERARVAVAGTNTHVGQARRADRAPRQLEPAIAPSLRVDERLERRRRAAEHDGNVALPRAPDRDIARVIAHAVLLLVRGVVFLVDDDEPEPRQRREHGEPRAEDEIRVARSRRRSQLRTALACRRAGCAASTVRWPGSAVARCAARVAASG